MSGNSERVRAEKGPYDDGTKRWCFKCSGRVLTQCLGASISRDRSEIHVRLIHSCLDCGYNFETVKTIVR